MPLAEVSAVSESWVASCYGFPVVGRYQVGCRPRANGRMSAPQRQ